MTGPLISPHDLEVRRQHGDIVILDATVELAPAAHDGDHRSVSGLAGWQRAHIPGSRHADLLHTLSDPAAPYHFAAPPPEALAAALHDLGVRDGIPVVTYDRAGGLWAARLWYLLDWLGLESYVLNGGLPAWQSAALPVASTRESPAGPEGPYAGPEGAVRASRDRESAALPAAGGRRASAGSEGSLGALETPLAASRAGAITVRAKGGRWVGAGELRAWLAGDVDATVVCALNPEAYAGEVPTRYSRRGHIPGSGNLPARSLTGADGRFLPEPELRAALGDLVDDPAPVWLYCGGGISATVVALALAVVGRSDVALYDGSLEEWSADPALPLELGRAGSAA
ncbi:sulfurtransferase [Actinoplanes awajinensis]|uniref:Rhodanese domain-containing protein n=1 Tax=Actinoplanes awajinensis subsp. mycoplanecinus TaxID=135947 RepID=A0A101JBL2_9ACTN|nr:rhodanese-like domain-containing protein [Actinoplanes awajinensis]KUL23795.1 hypothetical protein ADL15_45145 [Actinoplanes awajinensis subsp. mycoplanecinus]